MQMSPMYAYDIGRMMEEAEQKLTQLVRTDEASIESEAYELKLLFRRLSRTLDMVQYNARSARLKSERTEPSIRKVAG